MATRLHLSDLYNVDADRLTDELAAGCYDSTPRGIAELRADVARMLHEMWGPFTLYGEGGCEMREATVEETVASVRSGPEGWIEVEGVRCYVAE